MTTKQFFSAALLSSTLALGFGASRPVTAGVDSQLLKLVSVTPENAFVPPGFNNRENAQVVLTGELVNTCFKIGPTAVSIDSANKKVFLTQQAYFFNGCFCADIVTPYVQTVNLGVLPAGNFQVLVLNGNHQFVEKAALPIAVGMGPGPDDRLYAPVEEAFLDQTSPSATPALILRGTFTTSCMDLDHVQVLYRIPNVIEVLPYAEYKPGANCVQTSRPFEAQVVLQSPWHGSSLVHIRSLNGQSINKVYNFQ